MDIFDSVQGAAEQRPAKLVAPFFCKTDSDAKAQLAQLKEFCKTAPESVRDRVEQDIKMLSYGIAGEDAVAFELKSSHLPLIVLHDLHLEYENLSAQIDYLVITPKFNLVLECKNLIGNIEVTAGGEFIRTLEYGGRVKREGIYSPITQNTRHLKLIKDIRGAAKGNFLTRAIFEKYFDENYKSIVVLANPKTVLNCKAAPKEIRRQIIRCDQLIEYIQKLLKESSEYSSGTKSMFELADAFLGKHTPNTVDYTQKYLAAYTEPQQPSIEPAATATPPAQEASAAPEESPLYRELRQYRYDTSKAENVKPYYLFNNAQLEELISAKPQTLEELKSIFGFGDVKCRKYGDAILAIIKKHSTMA